jgi:hypothetical protein
MDASEQSVSGRSVVGFFKYVFNFDEDNMCGILNLLQYTIMAIIPVLFILKGVKNLIPEEDETKGSLEILVESLGQIVLIVSAIWITNKMIRYFPTYSGCDYDDFNAINFMIPFLIILSTMQSKLGLKLNILMDRVLDFWHGRDSSSAAASAAVAAKNNVRVTQPIAGQPVPQHQPSQSDFRDQLLPSNPQLTQMPSQHIGVAKPPQSMTPDFNQMHQVQVTPSQQQMFEPMAANEGIGSMFGSSW